MKKVIINGIEFEVVKSQMHPVAPINGCNEDEIFEVYDRPSYTKVCIWKSWCKWCREVQQNVECGIEISGHNVSTFTITGQIRTEEHTYDLWITKAHNRIYIYR